MELQRVILKNRVLLKWALKKQKDKTGAGTVERGFESTNASLKGKVYRWTRTKGEDHRGISWRNVETIAGTISSGTT